MPKSRFRYVGGRTYGHEPAAYTATPWHVHVGCINSPEIVCFCDIPTDQLTIHTSKYSRFGFAFEKSFLIGQGANPVWYVAKNARTTMRLFSEGEFANFFDGDFESKNRGVFLDRMKERLLAMDKRERASIQKTFLSYARGQDDPGYFREILVQHVDLMIGLFAYIFGYVETFDPCLAENDPNDYYMEREWRVIGKVRFSPRDISCVLLPKGYVDRFRGASDFNGEIAAL